MHHVRTLIAVALVAGMLHGSSIARAQAARERRDHIHQPDFFPVSVWYSGGKARAPMLSEITPNSEAEWRRDLEQIRDLGFNTVRTWVEWAHCEPQEGQFRFENLDLLCRLANEVGLRVIVQVYADSAPDWVGVKHPDAQYEAQSGAKVPSQAAPGFCSDKPEVRELIARFYSEAARVASRYPNLHAWDLWSEPHIINWAVITYVPNAQFCFCPHTRRAFRNWLVAPADAPPGTRGRYANLAELNRAWYRNFTDISQVDPPRFGTILSYTDFIDWKTFIYEKLADDMRWRYEAIRRVDPRSTITSHAAVPSIFTSPFSGDGASDDFLMAEQLDYYGTSLYPKHSFPHTHWPLWQFNVAIDFSRSANRRHGGFYVGELQAGFGVRGVVVGDPIDHEDQRVWMWSTVSRGARAINFFAYYPMSSGYESGGYGLIELDGTITPRAREAGRAAQIIHRHRELFLRSRPAKTEVAVLYNPLSQMVGGEQNSGPASGHKDSLIGYYRALLEANIPMDFVHRRELEAGQLDGYKLLIVPYPIMFTQRAADGLKAFVEKGGHVVAEARLAWNDSSGYAAEVIPGMGLSEVFGVRESYVKMGQDQPIIPADVEHPVLEGIEGNLKGGYFIEGFRPRPGAKTTVLAKLENGEPAIVASEYGRGRTIVLGTFLGLGSHPNRHAANSRFITNLAAWAGVRSPVRVARTTDMDPPVQAIVRDTVDGSLLFLINAGAKPGECTVLVDRPAVLAVDLLTGREQPIEREGESVRLTCALERRGVAVIHLRSK